MGKYDESLYEYFSVREYYADLLNASLYQGRQVIRPEELQHRDGRVQISAKSEDTQACNKGKKKKQARNPYGPKSLYRDIRMELPNGTKFVLFALENQSAIDYEMPWRIMRYDCAAYGAQIKELHRIKRKALQQAEITAAKAEGRAPKTVRSSWRDRMDAGDRLCPVYTICFYHGTEEWTGPRSLRDMMDFGEDGGRWKASFNDYPMILVCPDDEGLADRCKTGLKWFLKALGARGDRKALKNLLESEEMKNVDLETWQVTTTVVGMHKLNPDIEIYKNEKGGYNMCQALRELTEEAEGRGEKRGEYKKLIQTVDSVMHYAHVDLKEACRMTGNTVRSYHAAKRALAR